MDIQIDPHTLERAAERGASLDEIKEVLNCGIEVPAKYGKRSRYKVFDFGKTRNNKYYEHKRIELIYVIENDNVITVTVYVFYGKWSDR